MEAETCLGELSTLVDHIDTGFPQLMDFRGELSQTFLLGQRVMSYFLNIKHRQPRLFMRSWNAIKQILSINVGMISMLSGKKLLNIKPTCKEMA